MKKAKCIVAAVTAISMILSVGTEMISAVSSDDESVYLPEMSESKETPDTSVPDSETKEDDQADVGINTIGDMSILELMDMELADFEVPEVISFSEIEKQKNVNRLYAQEMDEYTAVFQNKDGTKTMYLFAQPIKYIDENGVAWDKQTWLSSDVQSVEPELAEDYAYVNPENDVNTFFPAELSSDSGMVVSSENYKVELFPDIGRDYAVPSSEIITMTSSTGHEKNYIEYENVFAEDSRIRYSASLNGMKEDIVLDSYSGVNEFSFILKTNGLKLVDMDGYFILADPDSGEEAGGVSEVILFDSSNGENTIVPQGYVAGYKAEETVENSEYKITITIDKDFLENEAVYPVIIDPSITVRSSGSGSSKTIFDAPVYSKTPSTNYGSADTGTVGYDSSNGIGRLMIRFPGLESNTNFKYMSYDQIKSAKLVLTEYTGNTATSTIQVRYTMGSAGWAETYPTYSNTSASGTVLETTKISKSGTCSIDFTQTAILWKRGGNDMTKGILLTNANESSSTYRRSFYMSEYSSSVPAVTITWEPVIDNTAYVIKTGTASALDGDCLTNGAAVCKTTYSTTAGGQEQLWIAKLSLTGGYVFYSAASENEALCHAINSSTGYTVNVAECTTETNPYFCWEIEKVSSSRYALKNMYANQWLACDSSGYFYLTNTQSSRQLFVLSSDGNKFYYDGGYAGQSGTYQVNLIFATGSLQNQSAEFNFGTVKTAVEKWNGICDNVKVTAYSGSLPSNAPDGLTINVYAKNDTTTTDLAYFVPNGTLSSSMLSNTTYDNRMNSTISQGVIFLNTNASWSKWPVSHWHDVITHEVGHVLFLSHTAERNANQSYDFYPSSIMQANVGNMANCITAYDKSNLVKKWRTMS